LLSLGLYRLLDGIKEMGYEPCVLSIESAFGQALNSDEFRQKIVLANEWRYLADDEERLLFDSLRPTKGRYDCKQFPEYGDGSVFKGESGRIKAIREGERVFVRIEVDNGYPRIIPEFTPSQ